MLSGLKLGQLAPVAVAAAVAATAVGAATLNGTPGAQDSGPSSAASGPKQAPADRRPATVVKLDDAERAHPTDLTLDVAAQAQELGLESVVYRAKAAGECAAVVGAGETQVLCRPSLGSALKKEQVLIAAVGPELQVAKIGDKTGTETKPYFAWGVTDDRTASVRLTNKASGDAVAVPTYVNAEWPGLRFFLAHADLRVATEIALLDDSGAVTHTRDW